MVKKDHGRQRILIVDDIPENIKVLGESLKNDFQVIAAVNGTKALEIVQSTAPPDMILLDVMMPHMDGYEVCRRLKQDNATRDIPVIFITARGDVEDETAGLEIGAVDYLTKPVNPAIVKARVITHLELKENREILKRQNLLLDQRVRERTKELMITQDVTIQCMATLAETRDNETGGHIRRTQNYMQILAEELSRQGRYGDFLNERTIDLLYKSAPLHDIGKVGVPDSILLKPAKLNDQEFAEMQKHTVYGRNAIVTAESQLGTNSFLMFAKEIAYSHHEKWDGTGYPEGRRGREIPLSGRFMALVDVYDALISKRIYKPPFPHSRAVEIIAEGAGIHFDPNLVEAFASITEKFRKIALEYADCDSEREALIL